MRFSGIRRLIILLHIAQSVAFPRSLNMNMPKGSDYVLDDTKKSSSGSLYNKEDMHIFFFVLLILPHGHFHLDHVFMSQPYLHFVISFFARVSFLSLPPC